MDILNCGELSAANPALQRTPELASTVLACSRSRLRAPLEDFDMAPLRGSSVRRRCRR